MKVFIVLLLLPFFLSANDFAYLDCYVADLKTGEKTDKIFEFDWDKKYDVVDFRFFTKDGENTTSFSNIKIFSISNSRPKFTLSNKYFNWESSVNISPDLNFENISISIDRTNLSHKSHIYPKARSHSKFELFYEVSGKCELNKSRASTQLF